MLQFDTIRLSGLGVIDLPIFGVQTTSPYQITAADGLGPPEFDLVLAETHAPGGIFVSRRSQGREIVIRIGLNPNHLEGQTISDLRYTLYGLLSPNVDPGNQSIDILLMQDNITQATVTGYVKRIEIVPFNKDPEVQLTISCLGPYFNAPAVTSVEIDENSSSFTVDNAGLAPTGIAFEITFNTILSSFTISVVGGKTMRFNTAIQANDILTVNTDEASRFVGLKRNDIYIRYMEILANESEWITLHGGTHTFQVTEPTTFSWNSFQYRIRYWGI